MVTIGYKGASGLHADAKLMQSFCCGHRKEARLSTEFRNDGNVFASGRIPLLTKEGNTPPIRDRNSKTQHLGSTTFRKHHMLSLRPRLQVLERILMPDEEEDRLADRGTVAGMSLVLYGGR